MKLIYARYQNFFPYNHVLFRISEYFGSPMVVKRCSTKEELMIGLELKYPQAYLVPLSEHEVADDQMRTIEYFHFEDVEIVKGIDDESVRRMVFEGDL